MSRRPRELPRRALRRIGWALLLAAVVAPVRGQVLLNEIMAANETSVPEMVDFGDFEDWIELVNVGATAVDLAGYTLTDDPAEPARWTFPAGASLDGGGFHLVWADGRDTPAGARLTRPWWPGNVRFTTRWYHGAFRLDRDAEGVWLFDPSGALVDSVTFRDQLVDTSLGRRPDGGPSWHAFADPTPLGPNVTAPLAIPEIGPGVTIEPAAGRYAGPVAVTLSAASGPVRFTLDGSRPTARSPVYSSPIAVAATTVVRARVWETGALPGPVATSTFLIGTSHEIPIISVSTDPELLWNRDGGIYLNSLKEREIPVGLEFFPGPGREARVDAGARIGGENIFRFAQKPFNLYFRSEYGYPHLDYRVFDRLPYRSFKRLFLRNGGDDWPHTMMRDGFQAELLAGFVTGATQAYRPSVVYLNGTYWGIHNLREKVDDQYFLLHEGVNPADLDHLESDGTVITGDSTDFMALVDFAATHDLRGATSYASVAAQVNLESLMDFVIVQSYVSNGSWEHNREVWRDRGGDGRWSWVIVDLDRGWDVRRLGDDRLLDQTVRLGLFGRLIAHVGFREAFIRRYARHLNSTFRPARAIRLIDSLASAIESEIPRHAARWGPYIDSLSIPEWGIEPGIQSVAAWRSAVDDMRRFARERPDGAVQQVVSRFGLAGGARLVVDVEPGAAGRIRADGLDVAAGDTLRLFRGIPVELVAEPPPGFSFVRWTERLVQDTTLVPRGADWRYLDGDARAPAGWEESGFDDGGWPGGPAELGYGDGGEATVVSYGSDPGAKAITAWFRTSFEVADPSAWETLAFDLVRDDGAVVYLNGTETVRSNLPEGVITPDTRALTAVGGTDESRAYRFTTTAEALVAGTNVLAVEVHQVDGRSSDLGFDLALSATPAGVPESEPSRSPALRYVPPPSARLTAVFEPETSHALVASITTDTRLTAAESPWLVASDVVVAAGATLSAEPGVVLRIAPGVALGGAGRIAFEGAPDRPVRLEPYYAGNPWAGICLEASPTESVFAHVEFTGVAGRGTGCPAAMSAGGTAVRIVGGSFTDVALPIHTRETALTIDGVRFKRVTGVGDYVTAEGGRVDIRNCVFEGSPADDMDAIDLGPLEQGSVVSGNVIRGFSGPNSDGIDLGEGSRDVLIEANLIEDVADKAVSVGGGSSALIRRNVFVRNGEGVGVKDSLSFADIRHSTFVANGIGVAVFEKNPGRGGARASVTGSVFVASVQSDVWADDLSSLDVTRSLSADSLPGGSGNLQADPLLVDPTRGRAHLQFASPAIDAGDPAGGADPDGSAPDLGALPWAGFTDGDVAVNEINYHSAPAFDPGDWVELVNRSAEPVDLSGWTLVDGGLEAAYPFDAATVLDPGRTLVVARDPARFEAVFPAAGPLLGPLLRGLDGNGDSLYLYDHEGHLVDSLAYGDSAPWPVAPDGGGPTLELISPDLDNASAASWAPSTGHGTPGARNSVASTGLAGTTADGFVLEPPSPNPFRDALTIEFALPAPSNVILAVYDVLGRRVGTLAEGPRGAGRHWAEWNAPDLPSGVYFVTLVSGTDRGGTRRARRPVVRVR